MLDLWGPCEGLRVLGIGFPGPLMTLWQGNAATCVGAVPEEIGEVRHVFTHFALTLKVWRAECETLAAGTPLPRVVESLPSVFAKAIKLAL